MKQNVSSGETKCFMGMEQSVPSGWHNLFLGQEQKRIPDGGRLASRPGTFLYLYYIYARLACASGPPNIFGEHILAIAVSLLHVRVGSRIVSSVRATQRELIRVAERVYILAQRLHTTDIVVSLC